MPRDLTKDRAAHFALSDWSESKIAEHQAMVKALQNTPKLGRYHAPTERAKKRARRERIRLIAYMVGGTIAYAAILLFLMLQTP